MKSSGRFFSEVPLLIPAIRYKHVYNRIVDKEIFRVCWSKGHDSFMHCSTWKLKEPQYLCIGNFFKIEFDFVLEMADGMYLCIDNRIEYWDLTQNKPHYAQ